MATSLLSHSHVFRNSGADKRNQTMPDAEAYELDQGFIDYLTSVSNEGLSSLELQRVGQVSEGARQIRQWLDARVEEICVQKQEERTASTQTARDGHFQRARTLKVEAVRELYRILEEWSEHRLVMHLVQVVKQLPKSRTARLEPVTPVQSFAKLPERPTPMESSQLREIVTQQVADLLADPDDFAFGGWFRDRMESNAIRKRQSSKDRYLWHEHFDEHGCLRCQANDAQYGGCGFCHRCYCQIKYRLSRIRQRHEERARGVTEGLPSPRRANGQIKPFRTGMARFPSGMEQNPVGRPRTR